MTDVLPNPRAHLEPIVERSVWYGRDLEQSDEWIEELSNEEVAEIRAAVAQIDGAGKAILDLTIDDFPFSPPLAERLAALGRELDQGRGFWLLRGLPKEEMTNHEAAVAFWGIGLHLGHPVSQNARGHLLGHVLDEGKSIREPSTRGYQTRVRLPYHTDSSDVVGLMCLHGSKEGGLSSVASTTTVFNEVLARRPDLAHLWFNDWYFDRRNENLAGEDPFFRTPLATWHEGRLSVRYVRGFMDSAQRHDEVPRRTDEEKQFLDLIDEVAAEPGIALNMDFQPGDVQFVCNYTTFHSRTEFEDWPEPERRRHLLRLWIALHEGRPLPDSYGRGLVEGEKGRGGIAPVPGVFEAEHRGTNI